ncbi:hypothetical protein OF83DRAFT_503433 [Amylostereum chailletii]|nr:hypothetical protein OF83DRAFT_503433 [Amylostereum chailletii]
MSRCRRCRTTTLFQAFADRMVELPSQCATPCNPRITDESDVSYLGPYIRHPTFWFDDGSDLMRCGKTVLKIHRDILSTRLGLQAEVGTTYFHSRKGPGLYLSSRTR